MEENDMKRIISRLAFIKTDLEAISKVKMDEEMMKIVDEINEKVEGLRGKLIGEKNGK